MGFWLRQAFEHHRYHGEFCKALGDDGGTSASESDTKRSPVIAEGFAKLAMISVILERLTEPKPHPET